MTEAEYQEAMAEIETLLAVGSANMSKEQISRLRTLSLRASDYEKIHFPLI